jgi:hypothetical protein
LRFPGWGLRGQAPRRRNGLLEPIEFGAQSAQDFDDVHGQIGSVQDSGVPGADF